MLEIWDFDAGMVDGNCDLGAGWWMVVGLVAIRDLDVGGNFEWWRR